MIDRDEGRPTPDLRDIQYQAERIVATTAAGIQRRQRTAFIEARNRDTGRLDRAREQTHTVLLCADSLRLAYQALEDAIRRVGARIVATELELASIEASLPRGDRVGSIPAADPPTPAVSASREQPPAPAHQPPQPPPRAAPEPGWEDLDRAA